LWITLIKVNKTVIYRAGARLKILFSAFLLSKKIHLSSHFPRNL
jgi:hypothetical protein